MENNKFNKFYSKKSVIDLIVQIRAHRTTGGILEKEWYEALIKHLSERDITEEERKIVDHILSDDPEILMQEKMVDALREVKSSNITPKVSGINAAGKSLKNIVECAIIMILCTTFGFWIAISSNDPDTKKYIYISIGIISLICNIIILISLYKAGDHLENS